MPLTKNDYSTIRAMRTEEILENVSPHKIDGKGRNHILMCSDGNQCPGTIRRHFKFLGIQERSRDKRCCHVTALNGGALLLSPSFITLAQERELCTHALDDVILEQISQALKLKGTTTVGLYIHAPCGLAGLLGLSFEHTLWHLFAAKARVLKYFVTQSIKVICFVQIDYGLFEPHKKLTYFISRKNWERWLGVHPFELSEELGPDAFRIPREINLERTISA